MNKVLEDEITIDGDVQRTIETVVEMRLRSLKINGPRWAKNMAINYPHVKKPYSDVVEMFPEIVTQRNVMIFASGPSLSRYEGKLHKLNDIAVVIASPTNIPWLIDQGVRVDMCVVVDSHAGMWQKIKGVYEGPIVCPPTVHPGINDLPNPVYWFKLLMGTGQSDDPQFGLWNLIMNGIFGDKLQYGFLASAACVTNMAFLIASDFLFQRIFIGDKIILAGADYAYWKGFSRIENPLRPRPNEVDLMEWEGMPTNARMVVYKYALYQAWMKVVGLPVYSMSDGILSEITNVTLDQILNDDFPKYPEPQELIDRTQPFRKAFLKQFGKNIKDEDGE